MTSRSPHYFTSDRHLFHEKSIDFDKKPGPAYNAGFHTIVDQVFLTITKEEVANNYLPVISTQIESRVTLTKRKELSSAQNIND